MVKYFQSIVAIGAHFLVLATQSLFMFLPSDFQYVCPPDEGLILLMDKHVCHDVVGPRTKTLVLNKYCVSSRYHCVLGP